MRIDLFSAFATVLLALAAAGVGHGLLQLSPLPRPTLGRRGVRRQQLLERAGALAPLELLVRWLAALCARLPWADARVRLDRLLERAGHSWGLCADECLALCALLGCSAIALSATLGLGTAALASCLCLVAAAPVLRLHEQARARQRIIARRLPVAIDLMVLCMGAGLDFTGALELVVEELAEPDDPLSDELRRVLQELAMGRARRRVLAELAERVPSATVCDFARAVIQADEKGNPLAQVLEVQAQVLRRRRSVAAEEAAARAAVLLVLPLLLLLAAVLLVLFGPFIVNGVGL